MRNTKERILIIDDDRLFCEALGTTLESVGYRVALAHTLERGRQLLAKTEVAVAFVDVHLPDGNGLVFLPELAQMPEPPGIIVITAEGDPEGAESAITAGAWDYVQKPAHMGEIVLTVQRVIQNRRSSAQLPDDFSQWGIVAEGHAMRQTMRQMLTAAHSDAPVLIIGETGTGKELVARAVHANSGRAGGPFVVVDCGALSPTLIDSELFGNVRGAFTGAGQSRRGLVPMAHGGTLFIDEVGELPLEQQSMFLRLIQERRFRPLGGTEEVESDFRVVAATNRELWQMAKNGDFREDLYFRLRGVLIEVPPLRTRGEDVDLLADFALGRCVKHYGLGEKSFSQQVRDALHSYPWPGNVRELISVVESAAQAARGESLVLVQHLPRYLRAYAARARAEERSALLRPAPEQPTASAAFEDAPSGTPPAKGGEGSAPRAPGESGAGQLEVPHPTGLQAGRSPALTDESLENLRGGGDLSVFPGTWEDFHKTVLYDRKRRYLLDLLRSAGGRVAEAAQSAGLSRQRLYALLREHGISRTWLS